MQSIKLFDHVNRIQDQKPTKAIILQIIDDYALISYEESGQGWWPLSELVALNTSLDVAQWLEFSNTIGAMNEINQLLIAIFQLRPALYGKLIVGLGKAADGDSQIFLAAWNEAKTLGLIPNELITPLRVLATTYGLPLEFVQGL